MASTKLPARLLDTSAVPELTVTGNLTVDTSTLKVDSSNNRIGVGTTSPLGPLHVVGDANATGISHTYVYDSTSLSVEAGEPAIQLKAADSGTHGGSLLWRYGNNVFSAIANPTDDTIDWVYGVTNANDFDVHGGTNLSSYLKIMTIGADGRIGIGTSSPAYKLDVQSTSDPAQIRLKEDGNTNGFIFKNYDGNEAQLVNADDGPMVFKTNDSERLRIGSAGQIGIGGANYGTSGQVLTSTGASTAPSWQTAGGGKLLQVVQTVKTDTWSSSSTNTWVDITGLNVSITPASSSNKVLVDVHISLSNYSLASFRLVRGSTVIAVGDSLGGNRVQATMGALSFTRDGHRTSSASIRFLDSPSTTSSTTYKLQAWTYHGTQYINRSYTNQNATYTSSSISTITASEISA